MTTSLGPWAVIDIETTGIDQNYDQIIDIGYLQFEGTKLVRKYESLVRTDIELSYFIQDLTGITNEMVKRAPLWELVENNLLELEDHHLIAYNANFEEKFLENSFLDVEAEVSFEDAMPFMGLLFPSRSSLKLEQFIIDWKIAEGEQHRGFEDSLDLLKVLLTATSLYQNHYIEKYQTLCSLFSKYNSENYWFYKFFILDENELMDIADQIEFDLDKSVCEALNYETLGKSEEEYKSSSYPSYEFSGENIKAILNNEEHIKENVPYYRYRQTQEELALKAGQSLKNDVHALIQAPTGTGKTLGYLLPSALYSLSEQKQILIATGTKALQEQAMSKDVPQLRNILGLGKSDLRIKRLIGSKNHFCELSFRQLTDDLLNQVDQFDENFAKIFFEYIIYLNSIAESENFIFRDDTPYVLKRIFSSIRDYDKDIAVDFKACTGTFCPFSKDCTYIKSMREAKDAHIVVGNHALMYTWPKAFPRPAQVIVDEAHRLEDETTKSFSLEISKQELHVFAKNLNNQQGLGSLYYLLSDYEDEYGDVTQIINEIKEASQYTYQVLMDHLRPLEESFEVYFKQLPRFTSLYWNEVPFLAKEKQTDQNVLAITNHFESISYVLTQYYEVLLPHISRFEAGSATGPDELIAITRLSIFIGTLETLVSNLKVFLERETGHTHSLNYHSDESYYIRSSPIDIGKTIHQQLLNTSSSVVFVSATLANGDGSIGHKGMEWATGYLYLNPEKRFKTGTFLPSHYDYTNNTKVHLCDDLEHFSKESFVENAIDKILPLIQKLGGRTLLLFSAKKRFDLARELLLRKLGQAIPLFTQGMGPQVIEDFKKSKNGVLLGLESFGEGIDIPGENLQFIFIDKVPDLRMDLVINDRRHFYEGQFGNEFVDYYLGHRTRSLHQKLGRLMRRESDIGGIIIADSRVKKWKGRTMKQFNELMKPYSINRSSVEEACSNIEEFISNRS